MPGDVDVDIAGTLVSCLLDELDERCRFMDEFIADEFIDSVSALLDSRIIWNLESWAVVFLLDASPFFAGSKLCSVFLVSRAFKNS